MEKRLSIEGMSCAHCVKHVTEALKEVEGVTSVEVDLASKSALVQGEVKDENLKLAVEDAGYEVVSIETV